MKFRQIIKGKLSAWINLLRKGGENTMQFTQNNKQTKQIQSTNFLMAGVAGILAGATGITALALSDKDIRKQVGKKANELRASLQDWSTEKLQMLDRHDSEKKESIEAIIDKTDEEIPLKEETKIKN